MAQFDEEISRLELEVHAKHGSRFLARLQAMALMRRLSIQETVALLRNADVLAETAAVEEAMRSPEERAESERQSAEFFERSRRESKQIKARCRAKIEELKLMLGDEWRSAYRSWVSEGMP